jgi:hypothetical protein
LLGGIRRLSCSLWHHLSSFVVFLATSAPFLRAISHVSEHEKLGLIHVDDCPPVRVRRVQDDGDYRLVGRRDPAADSNPGEWLARNMRTPSDEHSVVLLNRCVCHLANLPLSVDGYTL